MFREANWPGPADEFKRSSSRCVDPVLGRPRSATVEHKCRGGIGIVSSIRGTPSSSSSDQSPVASQMGMSLLRQSDVSSRDGCARLGQFGLIAGQDVAG
jgi:hypothetical protein